MRAWRGKRSPSARTGRGHIAPAASIASTTAGPRPPAAPVITTCRSASSMARMIAPEASAWATSGRALLAAVQRRQVDAQNLRRLRLAAVDRLQDRRDVALDQLVQLQGVLREARDRISARRRPQRLLDVSDPRQRRRRGDDQALDQVLELADVAGPFEGSEEVERIRLDAHQNRLGCALAAAG